MNLQIPCSNSMLKHQQSGLWDSPMGFRFGSALVMSRWEVYGLSGRSWTHAWIGGRSPWNRWACSLGVRWFGGHEWGRRMGDRGWGGGGGGSCLLGWSVSYLFLHGPRWTDEGKMVIQKGREGTEDEVHEDGKREKREAKMHRRHFRASCTQSESYGVWVWCHLLWEEFDLCISNLQRVLVTVQWKCVLLDWRWTDF